MNKTNAFSFAGYCVSFAKMNKIRSKNFSGYNLNGIFR